MHDQLGRLVSEKHAGGDRFIECINQVGLHNTVTIFSFIIPGPDAKKCIRIDGRQFFFYPKSDKGVLTHLYKSGHRIKGHVKLIFDIGANIGQSIDRFQSIFPKSKIYSFEPTPNLFENLVQKYSSDNNSTNLTRCLCQVTANTRSFTTPAVIRRFTRSCNKIIV